MNKDKSNVVPIQPIEEEEFEEFSQDEYVPSFWLLGISIGALALLLLIWQLKDSGALHWMAL